MKRFFSIIILCALIYSCRPGIPKEIIQPDKLEKVLFDIHLVDGYIGTLMNKDTAKIVASSYYKGIYKKFGIDSALLSKSMDYYYSHPDVLDGIYGKVATELTNEKNKNDKMISDEDRLKQFQLSGTKFLDVPGSPRINGPKIGTNPFDINFVR